jgi:hypothetical protein
MTAQLTRRYATVAQFAEANPAFSEASLRWHIFEAPRNGLQAAAAIVRVGRRVLIDVDRFERWIRQGQTGYIDYDLRKRKPGRPRNETPQGATWGSY